MKDDTSLSFLKSATNITKNDEMKRINGEKTTKSTIYMVKKKNQHDTFPVTLGGSDVNAIKCIA